VGVSLLRGIDLTSSRTILVVLVLSVLTAVVAAVLLPLTLPAATREKPADGPTRPTARTVLRATGRYTARAVMVSVPVLLVVVLGGLLINRPMHYVRTLGDVIEAAAPRTQGTSRVTPLPDASVYGSVPASAWKASLQDAGDGSQKGTWTGPVSGITLPVRVVLPADYRPDDGRTYNVIEGIHGWVGDPESLVSGIASPKRLQEAIDAGRIPPSIMVFPSVNVDGSQHDCVNIAGRPAVETWTAEEIPRMIQASFPNVTTQRAGWMLMGISAGAYCAARTAFDVPQRFGSVGVISSYNRPTEGALAHGGQQLQAQNALSALLEQRTPDGLRFYVMGTQDDAYGAARTAWLMEDAVKEPDSVTIDTPRQGGDHRYPASGRALLGPVERPLPGAADLVGIGSGGLRRGRTACARGRYMGQGDRRRRQAPDGNAQGPAHGGVPLADARLAFRAQRPGHHHCGRGGVAGRGRYRPGLGSPLGPTARRR